VGRVPALFSTPLNGAMLLVVDSPSRLRLPVTSPPLRDVVGGGNCSTEVVQSKCMPLRRVCGGIAVIDRVGQRVLQFDVLGRSTTTAMMMALVGWDNAEKSTTDTMVRHLALLIEWERRWQDNITTLAGTKPTTMGMACCRVTTNTTTTTTMTAAQCQHCRGAAGGGGRSRNRVSFFPETTRALS
jgi:hypothetical protein